MKCVRIKIRLFKSPRVCPHEEHGLGQFGARLYERELLLRIYAISVLPLPARPDRFLVAAEEARRAADGRAAESGPP